MEPQGAVARGSDGGRRVGGWAGGSVAVTAPATSEFRFKSSARMRRDAATKQSCSVTPFQGPLFFPFPRRQLRNRHLLCDDAQSGLGLAFSNCWRNILHFLCLPYFMQQRFSPANSVMYSEGLSRC